MEHYLVYIVCIDGMQNNLTNLGQHTKQTQKQDMLV